MQIRNTMILWLLLFAGLGLTACRDADRGPATDAAGPMVIYVTNHPLQFMAERIGGGHVVVHLPAPEDVDPAEWTPDERTILQYQRADLILLNGAGYEKWIGHVSLPAAALVDTSRHFRDRFVEIPDTVTHSHGPHGTHTHAGLAFTTWLDPTLAIEQARVVKQALSDRLPQHAQQFAAAFEALARELGELDGALGQIVSRQPGRPLLASHPVYQYLQARYQLNLESLHWEPEEMPEDDRWQELDALLQRHPARWILWEDQPLEQTAARLAERGVSSVVYNPCSQPPDDGDFLTVMWQNAENLRTAFAGK
jgi:zinc transport system substrate-binding protein